MKILLAEDELVSRRVLQTHLAKWSYEVVLAENGAQAWDALQKQDPPRLALLDWMMPELDGVDVCRQVRLRSSGPYIYILLLTTKDAKTDVIEGLESGADDYLTKPFHPQELRARLRAGLRILQLEDKLVAAREEMEFKAMHDLLTGLWNRGAILEFLRHELVRSRREKTSLGVVLCDLDRFKSVNDTRGHLAGDEVLRETARRFTASIREYDEVGRYGGEEFLILLPGCNSAATRARAEDLRKVMAGLPVPYPEADIPVTMSVGALATCDWKHADSDALLRAADEALYRAKEAGRNRVAVALPGEFFSPAFAQDW